MTLVLLQEKAAEWRKDLWPAAVDFKKACDTVTHDALWQALTAQNVDPAYVQLLQQLYANQSGEVMTDKRSRVFPIQRGTKQGDPISPMLFNAVLEQIMRVCKAKWCRSGLGISMNRGDVDALGNLRFADDILLVTTTLPRITSMLADLSIEANKMGLQLHPDKTKILHNHHYITKRRPPNHVTANGMKIKILPAHGHTKYLGRKVCFSDSHRVEVENRISNAWRKFFMLKQELTGHRYSLSDRLRLFHGTITPTALYSSETWVMTAELENRLRKTQRQMLRMILHTPRRKHDNDNHAEEHAQRSTQPPAQPQTQPSYSPTDDSDENDSESRYTLL